MKIKRMSEEVRNKAGWIVFGVATILIVVVGAFFLVNNAKKNPLEGQWLSKGTSYFMDIDDEGDVEVTALIDGNTIEVDARYQIDKRAKTITISPELMSYEEAAKESEGALTAAEIDADLDALMTSFDYSLDNDKLTLREREYGEEIIFTRVK